MNNPMSPEDIAKHTKKLKALGILKINKNRTFEIDFQNLEATFEKLGKNKKLNALAKSKKTQMSMESASRKSASSSKKTSIHTGGANVTNIGHLRGLDPMGTCSVEPWELELQTNIDAYMKDDYIEGAAKSTIVQMYNVVENNPVLTVGVVVGVLATLGYQKLKSPTEKMIKEAHKKFKDTCESAPRFIRGLYYRALEGLGDRIYQGKKFAVKRLGGKMSRRTRTEATQPMLLGIPQNPQQARDMERHRLGEGQTGQKKVFKSSTSSNSQSGGRRIKKRSSKKKRKSKKK